VTATEEVLGELRKSGLPVTDQAGLAAIAEGEGGITFATLYSGGRLINSADASQITMLGRIRQWTGGFGSDGFPAWSGATAAGGQLSTAAGPWQDTHTTWKDYVARFGIEDFSPRSQIIFNLGLARSRFPAFSTALASGTPELIPAMLGKTWPGGCDCYFPKRYAKNLAVLQAPKPAPEPPPPPPTIEIEMSANAAATDQAGNQIPVTIHFKTVAIAAMLLGGAAIGGSIACAPPKPPPQQIAAEAPAEAVQERKDEPGSIWALSTFKLIPGPLGLLAVPLDK
jgi:hypothetical protein